MDPLANLATEARNPASSRLDELTSQEIVDLMTAEDALIPAAMMLVRREVALAVDAIAERFTRGGRLVYVGAGTSGRLGVVDASECPPTFQTPHTQVVGLIAGGPGAMFQAVEGAEDSPELGAQDLMALNLNANDVLVGIASSGRTPYVMGGLHHAKAVGAFTIALVCTPDSELSTAAELLIAPVVGPEILTGSTRLKAGTATKLVLNMLTTGAMIRLGKTFGNLMVDLKASNKKLVARSNRIVRTATGLDEAAADSLLKQCDGEVKTAIVVRLGKLGVAEARAKLVECKGRVRSAIGGSSAAVASDTRQLPKRLDLVIGIDGGGTTTKCLLADAKTGKLLGEGASGPSNIQAVGVENGLKALDAAIDRAFGAADLARSTVASACLGLAGVDRPEAHDVINGWAARVGLAEKVTVANDATLLVAAGTPNGWGLAVIAGTGSIAFVQKPDGVVSRAGGWGYLLGDEGSAYQLALKSLHAVCQAHDGCGPETSLNQAFLSKMNLTAPPDLIAAVYRGPWDRTAIAGLAPLVLAAAEQGDAVARGIVKQEAEALARTAAGAVASSGIATETVPVALAGGLLLGSQAFRGHFLEHLRHLGVIPGTVTPVNDPATGAVVLARR